MMSKMMSKLRRTTGPEPADQRLHLRPDGRARPVQAGEQVLAPDTVREPAVWVGLCLNLATAAGAEW